MKKNGMVIMSSEISNIAKINDHPKLLTRRVRDIGLDSEKISYSVDINDLASARELSMPQIWDCLEEGIVDHTGICNQGEEIRGYISYHSHEGLVTLYFALAEDDTWLEVLSASIEVK
jgi:hypothetical protein